MIVYRSQEERVPTARAVGRVQALTDRIAERDPDHDRVVALLVETGTLESALVDALCLEADDEHALERELRRLSLLAGRLFVRSWSGTGAVAPLVAELRRAAAALGTRPLPAEITGTVPEGFAFYGLYPESYHAAALDYAAAEEPDEVVCVGIRSIGTTLSAVVAATLAEAGIETRSWTVRPRGHPFHRELRLAGGLRERLRERTGAHFVVVDEGPGLSGSSFASVARALGEIGVADERIALFPSWLPDGASFVSAEARRQWSRHGKWSVDFDRVWLRSGRLAGAATDRLVDLSGGQWRERICGATRRPAVQTQHERRKFLLPDARPGELGLETERGGGTRPVLLKFAGLGRRAGLRLERARVLAEAGFGPPALGTVHGFLATEFVPGVPAAAGEADAVLLETAARYLAFVRRTFPAERTVSIERLDEMLRFNVREALGEPWEARIDALAPSRAAAENGFVVAGDGRMLAHEWIRTGAGYLKTDGVDHHDDHFFAGCQDVAWDVAGACVELELTPEARRGLVERYARQSGDAGVARRLPFFRAAYLAFRLGYARTAAAAVDAPEDRRGMLELVARYEAWLRRELSAPGAVRAPRGRHPARSENLTYAEERT